MLPDAKILGTLVNSRLKVRGKQYARFRAVRQSAVIGFISGAYAQLAVMLALLFCRCSQWDDCLLLRLTGTNGYFLHSLLVPKQG